MDERTLSAVEHSGQFPDCFCAEFSGVGSQTDTVSSADVQLIHGHDLCPHLYTDDTQMYGSCYPSTAAIHRQKMSACVDVVASWMRSNQLRVNTVKTPVL